MHFGRYTIWVAGVVVVVIVALGILAIDFWRHPSPGFDIPCQDGTWNETEQTCVPDPDLGAN